MVQNFRLKRIELPAPNLELDPTGRYTAIVEDKVTGETRTLIFPYAGDDVDPPELICTNIKAVLDPDTYDDDTCGEP